MSSFKPLILPGVGLLVIAGYWLWSSGTPAPAQSAADVDAKAKSAATRSGSASGSSAGSNGSGASPSTESTANKPGEVPAPVRVSKRDRAASNAIREQLRAAARSRSTGGGNGSDAPPPTEKLDATYIQARVREDLLPIAQECYETARETQPKLAGKLVMKFSIVGDPSVGGIVDEAAEDPSSDIKDPDLLECMRESMLSLSFPPPEDGGKVDVTYPFVFSSDGPPDEK